MPRADTRGAFSLLLIDLDIDVCDFWELLGDMFLDGIDVCADESRYAVGSAEHQLGEFLEVSPHFVVLFL